RPPCAALFPYTTLFRSLRRSSALPLRALLLRGWPRSDLAFLSRAVAPERREEDCEEAERRAAMGGVSSVAGRCCNGRTKDPSGRSEEHTSELQSQSNLV